ncbi:MAG: cell surface protein SprA [Gemmatimonadota bacterium]
MADSVASEDVAKGRTPALEAPARDAEAAAVDTPSPPPDTVPTGLRLGLGRVPLVWPHDLGTPEPRPGPLSPASPLGATEWLERALARRDTLLAAHRDTLWLASLFLDKLSGTPLRRMGPVGPDTTGELVGARRDAARAPQILPDALSRYADLDLQVGGSGQLRARWETFSPCVVGFGVNCNAGAVPDISPEFQLQAVARGTISERVHVDVDFDQTREFNAVNNISVFYLGRPDEIVRKIELGEVTMPLPRSRFISRGIPAGNFGVRGELRLGALELQAVVAEQGGNIQDREITLDVSGGEQGVLQDLEVVLDDAGYQGGQFYFTVDPRRIAGYPLIDVLNLQGTEVPDSLRPFSSVKLYRRESSIGTQVQNTESGVIQARAVAVRPPGADPTLPDSTEFRGFFRPLVEGEDFIVHRSGLWVVVRSRILRDEALAAAYISVTGGSIGDFDAEEKFRQLSNTGQGELPRLVLLNDPETHRPGGLTWEREMHHIYRISGSEDVEPGSVQLTISQGAIESGPIIRSFEGIDFTFLEIFGLDDQPRDDRLDEGRIWRPRNAGDFSGNTVIAGSYLVFPALEPFQDPPVLRASRVPSLQGQPFPLTEGDRNRTIYEDPIDQTRNSSSLYRLNFRYRSRSTGRASSFSLGAIGIRDGSERVTLNGRDLVRGEDYTIDYEIGRLTLIRSDELFSGVAKPALSVRFEQKPLFEVARKSIIGLTGTYRLGEWGRLGFVGLSQSESTVLTRPELGLEPGGMKLGGVTADVNLNAPFLTRAMNALPGVSTDRASWIQLDGELAGSVPTTNRFGTTFVDDFEGATGLAVPLVTRAWRHGSLLSRPEEDGLQNFLPDPPDGTNQLQATWQSQWLDQTLVRGPLLTLQVDPALRVLNPTAQETVLWISLADAPPGGGKGWAAITHVLSQTGLDLTTSEFLEFYASTLGNESPELALIIDVGVVSEDAFVRDSLGLVSGRGLLDQEADPAVGVWGIRDDTGLWGQGCRSQPNTTAFPLGDERANCTDNNGFEDTEDLNRDNFLNTDERFFRYIVPLNLPSRYLNRATGGEFRFSLYKIPLRDPDLREGLTDQGLQSIRHIRITLTADAPARVLLSRMDFTGSPWLKRAGTGSAGGLAGSVPGSAGTVTVGSISTREASYVSPPGVVEQQADRTDEIALTATQFNEQSLRVTFSDIPPGERIEVFRRFAETTRNFLRYRRMRAWVLPVRGEWGQMSPLRFSVRVGFDENNFYLYRTPRPAVPETPTSQDWRPEIRIEMERWVRLRAAAEQRILASRGGLPGDSALVVWDVDVLPDGDSTYAVVINDRSRAPNLAAIREMAIGIENIGTEALGGGEIWVNDLRLDQAADDTGVAARGALDLRAADILSLQADYDRQNPFFRQLGQGPSFESSWGFNSRARLQFGRFLPARWGLAVPLELQHARSSNDPFFLPSTDVRASEIAGLRTGESELTRFNVSLSRQGRSASPILRSTIDGLRIGYSRGWSSRVTTQSATSGWSWNLGVDWGRNVTDQSIRVLPGFLRGFIDLLPDFISESQLLKNLKDLRFRWTPRALRLGATLAQSEDRIRRFQSTVRRPADGSVQPSIRRDRPLRPAAGIDLQPFPSLTASLDFSSTRDLVPALLRVKGATSRQLLRNERRELLGMNIGWETSRTITTRLSYRPRLASWFEPALTVTTGFTTNRSESYIQTLGEDTTLVRDMRTDRQTRLNLSVHPDRFLTAFGVPERSEAGGAVRAIRSVWDRIKPIRFDWNRRVNASFDRAEVAPAFSDQFVTARLDNLRIAGTDTASSAGASERWSLEGGYRFPASLEGTLRYAVVEGRTFTLLSERRRREIEWPSLTVRWRRVPLPKGLRGVINNLSLNSGFVQRERLTNTVTGQDLGDDQTGITVGGILTFGNGFNLSYQYEKTTTERRDATGSSDTNRGSHDVRATGTLQPPDSWRFLRRPIRLSLAYSRNGNFECREIGGAGFAGFGGTGLLVGEDCVSHVDQTTQNVSFTLDTDFTGYSLGIQLTWVQRASEVGRQLRTNQYNLNIFGRFFFRTETEAEVRP